MSNDDFKTESHIQENSTQIKNYTVENEEEGNNFIKNFILNWGRQIIDFCAWVGVIFAILVFFGFFISFIKSLIEYNSYYGFAAYPLMLFACMIFIPAIILVITIITNYFIYLFIDIRDLLKSAKK